MDSKGYFPLLIKYTDGEKRTVNLPADIDSGRSFKVLETNVRSKQQNAR